MISKKKESMGDYNGKNYKKNISMSKAQAQSYPKMHVLK
jgi:hypothetical protein